MSARYQGVLLAGVLVLGAHALGGEPPENPTPSAPGPQAVSYLLDGTSRQGVVFVPNRSGPKPLVLLFDPGGNARGAVSTWVPAASRAGWMLASTPNVRNGTADAADAREMLGLLTAIKQKYPVDSAKIYTAGFSGGGCGAYLLALTRQEIFAGAFVQNAHMGSWREHGLASKLRPTDQSYYLFTRTNDFNRPAMQQLASALRGSGLEVNLVERAGGHQGMLPDDVAAAIVWMQGRMSRR